MRKIGFLISHKNSERRRAVLPEDLKGVANVDQLYFEEGYGESVGVSDAEYLEQGVHMIPRKEVLECPVLVDVKLGDADYLDELTEPKILVGWGHTVQNIDFTSACLKGGHTVIAWEEIFEKGRYIFYRNREVAGEAAVLQAFRFSGRLPYDAKVAILGTGQTAKGAFRILAGLGATIDVYARKQEAQFRENMFDYDVIVNCVMWDTKRTDRLIYREDLKKMKKGTLLIDVSCDPHLEIETSHPTTIQDPVYEEEGVIHYAVDNTPAMFPISVTKNLSKAFCGYFDALVTGELPASLEKACVIKDGHILDERITQFRTARGYFCQ